MIPVARPSFGNLLDSAPQSVTRPSLHVSLPPWGGVEKASSLSRWGVGAPRHLEHKRKRIISAGNLLDSAPRSVAWPSLHVSLPPWGGVEKASSLSRWGVGAPRHFEHKRKRMISAGNLLDSAPRSVARPSLHVSLPPWGGVEKASSLSRWGVGAPRHLEHKRKRMISAGNLLDSAPRSVTRPSLHVSLPPWGGVEKASSLSRWGVGAPRHLEHKRKRMISAGNLLDSAPRSVARPSLHVPLPPWGGVEKASSLSRWGVGAPRHLEHKRKRMISAGNLLDSAPRSVARPSLHVSLPPWGGVEKASSLSRWGVGAPRHFEHRRRRMISAWRPWLPYPVGG